MDKQMLDLFTDPLKWAQAFLRDPSDKELPFSPRSYQADVLANSRKFRRAVLLWGRQCLPKDTKILMFDGGYKSIQDIKIGDIVVSTNNDNLVVPGKVERTFFNGNQDIYKIRLCDGREIECTNNHPIRCQKNYQSEEYIWKTLEKGLAVGDRILVLDEYNKFKTFHDLDEARLLGYLVTDGHIVPTQTPKFTSCTYQYIQEVQEITKKKFGYNCTIKKRFDSEAYDIHLTDGNKGTPNLVIRWLKQINVIGTKDKFRSIFDRVQEYDKESTALFLNRVWSGDGCISVYPRKGREKYGLGVESKLCSINKEFLLEIQRILYKIGVRSKIKISTQKSPSSNKMCSIWHLYFGDHHSLKNFLNFTGPIYGKEKQSIQALEELNKRDSFLTEPTENNFYTCKIKSIEQVSSRPTYDITVESYHNFTVNGIVTHNSGKSVILCADLLWWTTTYPLVEMIEGKREKQHPIKVVIATPYEKQIKMLWETFTSLIGDSPLLKQQLKKIRMSDTHIIEFNNGSVIEGHTIGVGSSNKGTSLRGLHGDIVFLDELDFIPEEIIQSVILPIWTGNPDAMLRVSSTPSGKRGLFYKWFTEAKELGWYSSRVQSWHPDNIRWISIEKAKQMGIPINDSTEMQVKSVTPSDLYAREYGAEFGEELGGVYKHGFINKYLIRYGRDIDISDIDLFDPKFPQNHTHKYIMGVDWNSYMNGGQITVVEFCTTPTVVQYFDDQTGKDVTIDFTGKYRLFYRCGIKSKEATQRLTRMEIIRLMSQWKIDYLYVDYGAGDTNIEELTLYGRANPYLKLHEKLRVIDSGSVVEHYDHLLKKLVKKRNKSLMINFSVLALEEGMIILPKEEDVNTRLVGQMRGYTVKDITTRGEYSYEGDDHILDSFNLAIYGFQQNFGELLTSHVKYNILNIPDPRQGLYPNRNETVKSPFEFQSRYMDPEKAKTIQKPRRATLPQIGQRSNMNIRRPNIFGSSLRGRRGF